MALMSIKQAAANGIEYLRLPNWANPFDHLKIDIVEGGKPGPWTHLYAPFNQECNGQDPVNVLFTSMDYDGANWEVYTGAKAGSAEYVEAQARFEGSMSNPRPEYCDYHVFVKMCVVADSEAMARKLVQPYVNDMRLKPEVACIHEVKKVK